MKGRNLWLGHVAESGELRMKRYVLKILPSATVHVTLAEAAEKLRALCASGLFKFVGVPWREQVESHTVGRDCQVQPGEQ